MLALVALAWHEFGFHDNLEDPNDRGYDALRRLFLNVMAATLRTQTPNP